MKIITIIFYLVFSFCFVGVSMAASPLCGGGDDNNVNVNINQNKNKINGKQIMVFNDNDNDKYKYINTFTSIPRISNHSAPNIIYDPNKTKTIWKEVKVIKYNRLYYDLDELMSRNQRACRSFPNNFCHSTFSAE